VVVEVVMVEDLKMVMQEVQGEEEPLNPVSADQVLLGKVLVEEIHVVEAEVKFLAAVAVVLEVQVPMDHQVLVVHVVIDHITQVMEVMEFRIQFQDLLNGIPVVAEVVA
jgi:hypothetical protein